MGSPFHPSALGRHEQLGESEAAQFLRNSFSCYVLGVI